MTTISLEQRFWSKVDVRGPNECWEWTAAKNWDGYGHIWTGNRLQRASRVVWMLAHGEYPALDVLHRCDNPSCVNPAHLFLGTHRDNMRDMETKGRARHLKGAAHGRAKLTADQVLEIRRRFEAGETNRAALGREFGVTKEQVGHIIARREWTHIP